MNRFFAVGAREKIPLMPERIAWTRDQQLIALRLYVRTPFGKLHGRNPRIIVLAARIGRSPAAQSAERSVWALVPSLR